MTILYYLKEYWRNIYIMLNRVRGRVELGAAFSDKLEMIFVGADGDLFNICSFISSDPSTPLRSAQDDHGSMQSTFVPTSVVSCIVRINIDEFN